MVQSLGGGSGKQTQLTEDSAEFTIATSTTVSIQPATGEFDFVTIGEEAGQISTNLAAAIWDGTNQTSDVTILDLTRNYFSTNGFYVRITNFDGSNIATVERSIITMSEEA